MSKRSKVDEAVTEMAVEIADEAEQEKMNEATDLAAKTLTGDMRDFILDRLRHEQSKQPWHQRSESDQRETVHQVEAHCRDLVSKAVDIMAGHGRRTIKASIDSITVKDGIKAVLSLSKFDPNRHNLIDAQGAVVMIVVADPDTFTGERTTVAINPDQATLLPGSMVEHSTDDQPF